MMIFLLLLGIAAAILLPHLLLRKFGYRHLSYTLSFSADEVTEGEQVELIETICNQKLLPLPWVKAELTTDASLVFGGMEGAVTGETRFLSSFFCLYPYRKIERRRTVTCTRRGMYTVSHAVIMLTDLFGTVELSQLFGEACAALTVLPAVRRSVLPEELPQQNTGEALLRRTLLQDRYAFCGIRPYADGDPVRDISWSASARSEQMMVRQYQETATPALTVLLNCATRETDRGQTSDRSAYEDAIRVCASYLCTAAQARIPVRFCANTQIGGEPAETAFCTGKAGAQRMQRLLAALPLTVTGKFTRLVQRVCAEESARQIVAVTAYVDRELLRYAAQEPRLTVLTLRAPSGKLRNVQRIPRAAYAQAEGSSHLRTEQPNEKERGNYERKDYQCGFGSSDALQHGRMRR